MNRVGRWMRIGGAVMLVLASLTSMAWPAAMPASDAGLRSMRTIAPGVRLLEMVEPGPNRVKVLLIDPTRAVSVDVGLARSRLPGFARTSVIARNHGAIAAVNGDFGLDPGRPAHAFVSNGDLIQSSVLGKRGHNFAVSSDELQAYVGSPGVGVSLHQDSTGARWPVARWNQGPPRAGEVAGFTPKGGTLEPPPSNSCSARLKPQGHRYWSADGTGVERQYVVDSVVCQSSPLSTLGGVVLASQRTGVGAQELKTLSLGETVDLTWSLGWRGVLDSIGGSPLLLLDGELQVESCDSYLCMANPRTAVGITADGHIILMVVDGRQPGYSVGMTLLQLAKEMQAFGAVSAMNLDGGGSATMWVRGMGLVNSPADGGERAVSSALLVLPGPDDGDPDMGPLPDPLSKGPSMDGSVAWLAALDDPGSTGGLLDAMASGDAPSTGGMTLELRRDLDTFRRSQSG